MDERRGFITAYLRQRLAELDAAVEDAMCFGNDPEDESHLNWLNARRKVVWDAIRTFERDQAGPDIRASGEIQAEMLARIRKKVDRPGA